MTENPIRPDSTIRVLVADDHYVVRMGLVSVINTEPDMVVVGQAADGRQAIHLYREHKPDVVLMDLNMPVVHGTAATQQLCRDFPEAHVLVLTALDGDEDIFRALDAGALGYVLKNSNAENLIPAIRSVAAGKAWVSKDVAQRLATRKTFEPLTNRELEVLQQMSLGLANKEIADVLKISEHTAKDHIKRILAKLRVADRTEAVTVALQRGIIHL
jgi:DNA-binding NarL/FixJ family response regulator